MDQAIQIFGAVLILAAYVAAQVRLLSPVSSIYLLLNVIGSGILAILAYIDRQWGFVLLEGAWSAVSLVALVNVWRQRKRPAAVAESSTTRAASH
ncbi:MAG TPA: hypothetical protein VIL01_04690 [Thermomicrobiales bacterium]